MELMDLVLFFLAAVILCFWWLSWSPATAEKPKNLPPGPPGWPFVGNLFQVILSRKSFIYVVADLRAKYGPIFTMQMGQRTLIIVTNSNLIHEALVQRGPLFANRPPDSPIRLLFSVGKCAINSAEYGPLWRALRRNFVTELINPTRIKQCSWIRSWAIKNHMERIQNEASTKGYVEIMNNCRLTICSILICLCFGAKIDEEWIKEIESILKDVMMMTAPKLPDFLPILTFLFRSHVKEAKRLRKKQLDCLVPLIKERRAFVENNGKILGNRVDMVSPIGAAYVDSLFNLEPANRGKLSEEELVTLVSEIISAGTDTSATAIEWVLLHLVINQEIQEKLYEEIVNVVGVKTLVSESDVENMPYLAAIVKETFRMHPPSHFLLSHAVTNDTTLAGYTIPASCNVEIYTAWVTKDPTLWEEPNVFKPERFLNGDGVDVDITGMKGVKMLPFGAGRRICPAWSLGMLHVHLLLARMVHAYKWLPVADDPPDMTETFAFTVVMKNSLKAIMLRRLLS